MTMLDTVCVKIDNQAGCVCVCAALAINSLGNCRSVGRLRLPFAFCGNHGGAR